MRTDIATSTSFSAESYAAGTVGSAHNHDVMEAYSVTFQVTDSTPASKAFATTDVSVTANTILEAAHGYNNGLKVQLTTTTAVPAGLVADTDYYIVKVDADNYGFATTRANAILGTKIDITGAGTGTHTTVPQALAGLGLHVEVSMDNSLWLPLASTTQTSVGNTLMCFPPSGANTVAYNYVRPVLTCTSGQVTITAKFRSRGIAG